MAWSGAAAPSGAGVPDGGEDVFVTARFWHPRAAAVAILGEGAPVSASEPLC
ncbi:hypothetical protein FAGKG844_40166 [Frankia sp. AgKG'84/4]